MADFGNLFADLPPAAVPEELLTDLLKAPNLRIERIVSTGQASPAEGWYDQSWHEWVMVVQGAARLLLEGEEEPRTLGRGDYLNIPAHCRHRVVWTDPEQVTIWLAAHYD